MGELFKVVFVLTTLGLTSIGCNSTPPREVGSPTQIQAATTDPVGMEKFVPPEIEPTTTNSKEEQLVADPFYVYTYQSADGNRIFHDIGSYPDHRIIDIPLLGKPLWVLAAPYEQDIFWIVVLDTGLVQVFRMRADVLEEIEIPQNKLGPGMPPLLEVFTGKPKVVTYPDANPSPITHPVLLPLSMSPVVIDVEGNLRIFTPNEKPDLIDINALPDARILMDEQDRLLLLSEPTTRYTHGVLGDQIEASGISLVSVNPSPVFITKIPIEEPLVIEGISPIWADFNGDGFREIIVTLSGPNQGAQLAVISEDGDPFAISTPIGRGFRWRHQIAVAPLGPTGEMELVSIMTPHIGGIVEYFRLDSGNLVNVANLSGYSSHDLGSRNLDMAAVGDFDGDGHLELLVPNQGKTRLGAIRRTEAGAEEVWSLDIGGRITTNLTGAALPGQKLVLGVGRSDGILRIWYPGN